jgi:hypothetical protein
MPDRSVNGRRSRGVYDWLPGEGGPLTLPSVSNFKSLSGVTNDESRFVIEPPTQTKLSGHESVFVREGELMSKLHDLLHSPVGDGVACILEELHTLLPRSRSSV